MTLIERIDDLIKQAEEEKSHFYTANLLREVKEVLTSRTATGEMAVSESVAHLFWEQCAGQYTGHMAAIPYHPILRSILQCHECADDRHRFARFLRSVAGHLEKGNPF